MANVRIANAVEGNGSAVLLSIYLGDSWRSIQLYLDPTPKLQVSKNNSDWLPPVTLDQPLSVGVWKELHIHLANWRGLNGSGLVAVTIDGIDAGTATFPGNQPSDTSSDSTISLGIADAKGPLEPLRVDFDNVRIYY